MAGESGTPLRGGNVRQIVGAARKYARAVTPRPAYFYGAVGQFSASQNRGHGPDGRKIVYTRLIR